MKRRLHRMVFSVCHLGHPACPGLFQRLSERGIEVASVTCPSPGVVEVEAFHHDLSVLGRAVELIVMDYY